MHLTKEKLKEILVGPGHISQGDFNKAVEKSNSSFASLEDTLVENGLIKDEQLGKTIAGSFDFKFINLKNIRIDEGTLNLLPELVAKTKGIVIFFQNKNDVKLGMRDPTNIEIIHFIEKLLNKNVLPYYITQDGLETALLKYKKVLQEEFKGTLTKLHDTSLSREERDEIVVKMINNLLQHGYNNKASDIHIEPYRKKIIVRFRIDGVMHDVLRIPLELSDLIVTRIKILAKMRTDEHRAAQDGKFQFSVKDISFEKETGENVDVRVSIAPITVGENVVMRLLSAKSRQFGLTDLGFSESDFKKIEEAISKPHGMMLVTGPTGSGKTTTIYAIIKILNVRDIHISTIEDPVEYDIEGVSQIQVNTETNLTFAKGLRAIVRQDPDIIMVGEIRDKETSSIAVNSAMTGHLVLSTLHANDAATTLPRLLDMDIAPFLIASTVNIVIAQRLVRKICEKCRGSYTLTKNELEIVESDSIIQKLFKLRGKKNYKKITLFKGKGCDVCVGTGYSGRVGIFEILEMDEKIKNLVTKRASSDEILKEASKSGMTTMLEDGIKKAFQGITTLEEVIRVSKM